MSCTLKGSALSFGQHVGARKALQPYGSGNTASAPERRLCTSRPVGCQAVDLHDFEGPSAPVGVSTTSNGQAAHCVVAFVLERKVAVGEEIVIVGDNSVFGEWTPKQGRRMIWTEGHRWRANVVLPVGEPIAFKFVKTHGGAVEWEGGSDRVLSADDMNRGDLLVTAAWGQPMDVCTLKEVEEEEAVVALQLAADLAKSAQSGAVRAVADSAVAQVVMDKVAEVPEGYYMADIAIQKELFLGEYLKVVGNVKELGAWNHKEAPALTWTASHVWQLSVALPCGQPVEFKLVRANTALPDSCEWQSGQNLIIDPIELGVTSRGLLNVGCDWAGNARAHVVLMPSASSDSVAGSATTPELETAQVEGASDSAAQEKFKIDVVVPSGEVMSAESDDDLAPEAARKQPEQKDEAPKSNFFSDFLVNTLGVKRELVYGASPASKPPAEATVDLSAESAPALASQELGQDVVFNDLFQAITDAAPMGSKDEPPAASKDENVLAAKEGEALLAPEGAATAAAVDEAPADSAVVDLDSAPALASQELGQDAVFNELFQAIAEAAPAAVDSLWESALKSEDVAAEDKTDDSVSEGAIKVEKGSASAALETGEALEVQPSEADAANTPIVAAANVSAAFPPLPAGYTVEEINADDLDLLKAAAAQKVTPIADTAPVGAVTETRMEADVVNASEAGSATQSAAQGADGVAVTAIHQSPEEAALLSTASALTLHELFTKASPVEAPAQEPVQAVVQEQAELERADASAVAGGNEAGEDVHLAPAANGVTPLVDAEKSAVQPVNWGTGLEEITFTVAQLEELTRQGFASNLWAGIEDPVEENTVILKRGRLEVDGDGKTVVVPGGNLYNSVTDSMQVVDIDQVPAAEDDAEMQALATEILSKSAEDPRDGSLIRKIGKYAGYAAAGIGAVTLVGAMAIDITDIAIIGSVLAAGAAVGSAQDADVRKRGAAGPAISMLLTAADIAKRVSSLTRGGKQARKSAAGTQETLLKEMRAQLGGEGLAALEVAVHTTSVTSILEALDGGMSELDRIKTLTTMLLERAGAAPERPVDDARVAAAKQLALEHISSRAHHSQSTNPEQDVIVLAALALSAIEAGKGQSASE